MPTGASPTPSHGQRHHQHADGATTPRGPSISGGYFSDFGAVGALASDPRPGDFGGVAEAVRQAATGSPASPSAVPEYVINEHQHALLGCDVPNELLNLVQIFWLHDGAIADTVVMSQLAASALAGGSGPAAGASSGSSDGDAGHRYIRDPTTGSLTIAGARMEDDGVWGCQAKEATSRRVLHTGPSVRLIILGELQTRVRALRGGIFDLPRMYPKIKEFCHSA